MISPARVMQAQQQQTSSLAIYHLKLSAPSPYQQQRSIFLGIERGGSMLQIGSELAESYMESSCLLQSGSLVRVGR